MKTPFYIFILIFFSLYGTVNFYIGLRGWQSFAKGNGAMISSIYWVMFWALALCYIIARVSGKLLTPTLHNALVMTGSYWMAAMIYLLLILLSIDFIRYADKWLHFLPAWSNQGRQAAFYTGAAVMVTVIGIIIYGTWNAMNPRVTHYDVDIGKKAGTIDRLHIVVASDLHLGTIVRKDRLDSMVDGINALKPDLVLLPGDIFDDDSNIFEQMGISDSFKRLDARYGVFAALGNHEYFSGRTDDVVRLLDNGGVDVLRDRYVKVADSFYIVGRDDSSAQSNGIKLRKDLPAVMEGMDKTLPVILMDHQPSNLDEPASNGVDLQVSGHTHQGQLFPNQFITRKVFEIDWGSLKKGTFNIIVTSGYGTWGPPIRTGNHPEIVVADVKFGG